MRELRDERASRDGMHRDAFDTMYGTDTAKILSVGALDIPDALLAHANRYEAVMPEVFDFIMDRLQLRHEDYLLVDVGSGKGRALLLASRLPFKGVIGIEISAALTEIAEHNIRIFGEENKRCRSIQVVCVDATAYELPLENMVLYLYNPFDAQVMRAFVSNVEKSLRDSPRKLFVAYHPPLHRILWDESDSFSVLSDTDKAVIYESRCPGVLGSTGPALPEWSIGHPGDGRSCQGCADRDAGACGEVT
jgi:SAM-dependent methyltransferase